MVVIAPEMLVMIVLAREDGINSWRVVVFIGSVFEDNKVYEESFGEDVELGIVAPAALNLPAASSVLLGEPAADVRVCELKMYPATWIPMTETSAVLSVTSSHDTQVPEGAY